MPFEQIPPLTVHAYDITSGTHLTSLPYTSCRWGDGLNAAGSMNVTIDYSTTSARLNLCDLLRCWKVIIAIQRGDQVLHAGPLTSYSWNAETRSLSLDCGGGLTLLSKRLVLPRGLKDTWRDGAILVDEQHPSGELALTLTGSYPDIVRGLVDETIQYGPLPISPCRQSKAATTHAPTTRGTSPPSPTASTTSPAWRTVPRSDSTRASNRQGT